MTRKSSKHGTTGQLFRLYEVASAVYTVIFNKVERAVQWFRMLHAVFAGFSGHDNSIYGNMISSTYDINNDQKYILDPLKGV